MACFVDSAFIMLDLRRLAALALLGLAALTAPACLSPTLPLPPPEDPDVIRETAKGEWLIAGACDDDALVLIFNETRGQGVIRTCTHGSYAATIAGKACDLGFISEEAHDETSPQTEFALQTVSAGMPVGNGCQ